MWELIAKIVAAAISAVGGILSSYIYYKIKLSDLGEDDEEDVGEHVKRARRIEGELHSILNTVGADRVWVAQFHNGKKYYPPDSHNSMKKLSVTHESTSPGVSREMNVLSNMLVSFFSTMLHEVIEQDHVRYRSSESENSPNEVDILFRQRGCETMDLFSMKSLDDKLVGILGVDQVDGSVELSSDEMDYLNKKANLLGALLYYGDIERMEETN